MIRYPLIALFLLLTACQVKPTRVRNEETLAKAPMKGAEILQQNPVLLDVRPAFDFNLAHAPGAINVRWEDFSQQNPKSRGLPQTDLSGMARRLALIGVDLKSPVVVLGKGTAGQGEEGRVAWTLKILGVEKVYTLHSNVLKDRSVVRDIPPVENKPYWSPVEKALSSYMITQGDFKKAVSDTSVVILDVRSSEEVQLQSLAKSKKLKAQFFPLPWTQFFNDQGAPSEAGLRALEAKGLTSNSTLLVISNHGVRSAAVTYALQELGWKNVRNYAGGYEQYGYQ